jgi:hypothetical protein
LMKLELKLFGLAKILHANSVDLDRAKTALTVTPSVHFLTSSAHHQQTHSGRLELEKKKKTKESRSRPTPYRRVRVLKHQFVLEIKAKIDPLF